VNRAPRHANPGQEGEERWIWLRLKLIADTGLVGLPNAGKSTLLSRVSAAKPKIADYPFTTLHPHLGLVEAAGRRFVLADIPGLIEGAHEGAGIGDRFLGHVERCAVLVHLVDATSDDVAGDYRTVERELAAYGAGLEEKERLVVLTKIDALDAGEVEARRDALAAAFGRPVLAVSAVAGTGLDAVLAAVVERIAAHQAAAGESVPTKDGDGGSGDGDVVGGGGDGDVAGGGVVGDTHRQPAGPSWRP
jgi:GTP-binding protein